MMSDSTTTSRAIVVKLWTDADVGDGRGTAVSLMVQESPMVTAPATSTSMTKGRDMHDDLLRLANGHRFTTKCSAASRLDAGRSCCGRSAPQANNFYVVDWRD
jgi:hypothetical protein